MVHIALMMQALSASALIIHARVEAWNKHHGLDAGWHPHMWHSQNGG